MHCRCMHCRRIVDALSTHCRRIVDALSMHCLCIVFALSTHCLCIVFALSTHCLCIVYSLPMHCPRIVYALSLHCLTSFWEYLLPTSCSTPPTLMQRRSRCMHAMATCQTQRRWTFASLLRTRLELQNRSITLTQCTACRLACVKPVAIADGEETTANHFTCRARSWWKPAQSWPP